MRMLATGKVEVVTARPRTGRTTRRRSARSSPTGSGSPSRTSRSCTGTPRSPKGLDTYGSRSLVVGGEALVGAADKVIEKAKPIAAHLLEASADDLGVRRWAVLSAGTDQGMAIGEVALATFAGAQPTRTGVEPSLDAEGDLRPGELQLPTAPTCARWRSTPRPAS